jgi:hypothetical protein
MPEQQRAKALEDVGEMLVTSIPILPGRWFTQDKSTLGDKNEAAGAAAGRAFRTFERVALVAEKGVLCDHTSAADA